LVEVAVDGGAQLAGSQVLEVFAGALRDGIVHLLLEEREVALRRERESDRVRSAPPYDVPGRENARADGFAPGNAVAGLGEGHEHAVAVADGRDAVAEVDLRGL